MTIQEANFEGILLIDKPSGPSHDVVDRLRRKLRMKKLAMRVRSTQWLLG